MSNWQPDNSPNPPVPALACLPFADAMPAPQWSSGQFDTFDSPPSVWPAFLTGQKASPVRVLLVDDDEFIRRIIAQMLRQAGLEVHSVSTVESARQVLLAVEPDLVLLDYQLPDGTGLDLLRELKRRPAFQKLPVMMLTGKSDKQVIFDCITHGAADFIVKPVQQSALLAKLKAHLAH